MKNQSLLEVIKRIEKESIFNNEVNDLYSHLVLALTQGSTSLTEKLVEKEKNASLFGPIPLRPAPPLPLGCK